MSEHQDMSTRVQRLERTTRLLIVTVAVALLAAWSSQKESVVSAESFQLVDRDGSVLAELGLGEDGPGLFIRDREGRVRLKLVHEAEQTGAFIVDESGQTRIGIAQFSHGGGGVALHGPEAKGAAVLYLKGDGSLSFYGTDGKLSYRVPNAP